jgi:hypothetical protein
VGDTSTSGVSGMPVSSAMGDIFLMPPSPETRLRQISFEQLHANRKVLCLVTSSHITALESGKQ